MFLAAAVAGLIMPAKANDTPNSKVAALPGYNVSIFAQGTTSYFNPDSIDVAGKYVYVVIRISRPRMVRTIRQVPLCNTQERVKLSIHLPFSAIAMVCVLILIPICSGLLLTKMAIPALSLLILLLGLLRPMYFHLLLMVVGMMMSSLSMVKRLLLHPIRL